MTDSSTPPPSPATPTLAEQIQYVCNDIALASPQYADMPVLRAILASLTELASLQSRLAEVERDAARYRWLRDTGAVFTVRATGDDGSQCSVTPINRTACGLDAAIDAALSAASVDGDKGEGK